MPPQAIQYDDVLGSATTDKRIEVLRSIHEAGSISEAARMNGISYKAAWQAIETLSNLAGVALVEKAVGGQGGGGARLSAQGLQVLHAADVLHQARLQALASLDKQKVKSAWNVSGVAGLGLRTSMRNQLPCTVLTTQKSAGSVRVVLKLADDQTLTSRITHESQQLLGLKTGMQVLAMFKATAVTVAPTIVGMGATNLLQGVISRASSTQLQREVSLQLKPGLSLVGFSESDPALKLRQKAMAAIDESAVVIGLLT